MYTYTDTVHKHTLPHTHSKLFYLNKLPGGITCMLNVHTYLLRISEISKRISTHPMPRSRFTFFVFKSWVFAQLYIRSRKWQGQQLSTNKHTHTHPPTHSLTDCLENCYLLSQLLTRAHLRVLTMSTPNHLRLIIPNRFCDTACATITLCLHNRTHSHKQTMPTRRQEKKLYSEHSLSLSLVSNSIFSHRAWKAGFCGCACISGLDFIVWIRFWRFWHISLGFYCLAHTYTLTIFPLLPHNNAMCT